MNHTPEPWRLVMSDNATPHVMHELGVDFTDIGDHSSMVCTMPAEIVRSYNSYENARRIVACVNACAGDSTDDLEKHPAPIITKLLNERDVAEKQRDELIGLLSAAIAWISNAPHGDNCFVSDHYEGDPGAQCNCGKDSMLSAIDAAITNATKVES